MVFVPAISTFIISRMLGGGKHLLIGDLIEQQFLGSVYNPNVGSAMSLILMAIILVIMGIINHFDDEEMEGMLIWKGRVFFQKSISGLSFVFCMPRLSF